jgi:uncharacterized membrane protein YbhN (UPF0104 family)
MPSARRTPIFIVVVLAAFVVAIVYALRAGHRGFSWAPVTRALVQARVSYLVLAIVVLFAAYAMRAVRWKRFCRPLGPCRFSEVYAATLMGFAGIALLGRVGEGVRPILLARKCRFGISSMLGIWLVERLFDTCATAISPAAD